MWKVLAPKSKMLSRVFQPFVFIKFTLRPYNLGTDAWSIHADVSGEYYCKADSNKTVVASASVDSMVGGARPTWVERDWFQRLEQRHDEPL